MKRILALLTALLLLLLISSACAEVYVHQPLPEDWESRERLRVTFFPPAMNDAILIECGGESMLVDCGESMWREFLYDVLKARGLTHLTYLFNSHPHNDHVGAITKLIARGDVTADLFISVFEKEYGVEEQVELVYQLDKQQIPYEQMENFSTRYLGQEGHERMSFTLYACPEGRDRNERSGGLYLRYGEATLLLTADWGGAISGWFAETFPEIRADIIKAPHHGINNFLPAFLESVQPSLVAITNTRASTKTPTAQLTARGIRSIHTGDGTITMETDGTDWYVTQEKGWK